jgi:H+/Cl- antiporter ClcA
MKLPDRPTAARSINISPDPAASAEGAGAARDPVEEATFPGSSSHAVDAYEQALGDFTTEPSLLWLVPLAIAIGALAAGVSLALLDMIGFVTNLLYFQRLSVHLVSPNGNTLGLLAVVIPIGGGLIVGLMARFGSEQIRGHGIPEAMERILINGSQVQPRLAVLKPISSAISIGTGGPFGAEGPIILTGGAVGSIVGQLFQLTAIQRRSLLVAGAAAGMSAVFGTPVAATLFGVELLAFEFKPRSMTLIGLASATADGLRMLMAGGGLVAPQPLLAIPSHPELGGLALLGAAGIGIVVGGSAWVMTQAVYGAEDAFKKLSGHLHWMWWPMIGGLIIGVGGLIDSRALGVGYNTIHAELLGQLGIGALIALVCVKLVIWSCGLGGGTSGGILAPVLMMGAALGGILGHVLPGASTGVWALLGMAAALGGVTRSPFTAIIFAFELTHDQNSLLALLIAATVAHLVSVLVLKRSILTEKVACRGFHVMREYAVDPLEATFVREVMDTRHLHGRARPRAGRPVSLAARGLAAAAPAPLPGARFRRSAAGGAPVLDGARGQGLDGDRARGDDRRHDRRAPRRDPAPGREPYGRPGDRRAAGRRARRPRAPRRARHAVRPVARAPEAADRGASRRAAAATAAGRAEPTGARRGASSRTRALITTVGPSARRGRAVSSAAAGEGVQPRPDRGLAGGGCQFSDLPAARAFGRQPWRRAGAGMGE